MVLGIVKFVIKNKRAFRVDSGTRKAHNQNNLADQLDNDSDCTAQIAGGEPKGLPYAKIISRVSQFVNMKKEISELFFEAAKLLTLTAIAVLGIIGIVKFVMM